MATATDVVYRALSYNLNRQSEAEIEPDELQDGIDVLNQMMTSLEEQDVFLGYTYITDGSQQVTVSPGVLLGVTQNLGVQLAPMFGGKVSPELLNNARKSWNSILNIGLSPPKVAYDRRLPKGMGRRWYNQTYDVFFRGKVIPKAEMDFSNNTSLTVISAVSTPVVINATWTKRHARDFEVTDAGLLTYTGRETRNFNISARFTTTVTDKHVNYYVFVNGIQAEPSQTGDYVGTTVLIPLYFRVSLRKNDTVQFFVENIDDTTDILVADAVAEIQ